MATITAIAEQYGISDRQIRNYLGAIASAHPGQELKIDRQTLTEFAIEQIAEIRAIGPAAYGRRYAPVESQPEPIAPVQPQSQPQPEPAYEMATNPGHQLTTQAQPSQPAFADVATAPAAIVPRFAVIDGGLSAPIPAIPTAAPIVPMGRVGGQILQTTASAQAATQAVGQMIGALKQRMTLGADVLYVQDVQSTQQIESLETQLAELQAMASEYDRAARVQSVKESMRADRVGKLTDQVAQTAARLGFGLQPLSS